MKRLLILFFLTSVIQLSFSQQHQSYITTVNMEVGEPYRTFDALFRKFAIINEKSAVSVKVNDDKVIIQSYDLGKSTQKARNEYPNVSRRDHYGTLKTSAGFYFIYTKYTLGKFSMFCREINAIDASLSEPIHLFDTKGKVARLEAKQKDKPLVQFNFHLSSDKSKILISYRRTPEFRDDHLNYDILGFQMFDSSFNKLWGEEKKMPYTEFEMDNVAYMAGNDGKAYMVAYKKQDKNFELISIEREKQLNIIPFNSLRSQNLILASLNMLENNKGNIECYGYTVNPKKREFEMNGLFGMSLTRDATINGVYRMELAKSVEIIQYSDEEFDLETLNSFETKEVREEYSKREKIGDAGFHNVIPRNVYRTENGSAILFLEQVKYVSNQNSSFPTTYLKNIIISCYTKGEYQWTVKIPKHQVGPGIGFRYWMNDDENIEIIYIDHRNNDHTNIDKEPRVVGLNDGVLRRCTIELKTGNKQIDPMLYTYTKEFKAYKYTPQRLFKTKDGNYYVEVYNKKKNDVLVKIDLVR